MNRTKPSIHLHYSQRSIGGPGIYAYYDSGKNEIHILDKDTLYRTVLSHELRHSESRFMRYLDTFRIMQRPVVLVGLIGTMLGIWTLLATYLSVANLFIAVGLAIGITLMTIIGYFDYYLEEWLAERAAYDATDSTLVPITTLP